MSIRHVISCLVLAMAAFLIVATSMPASANVYASGFSQTGVNSFTYKLNENADAGVTVQVWEVGGGMVHSENLGAQTKGVQSWSWDGTGAQAGKTYKAKVVASANGYMGWTKISTDATSTSFYVPVGVSVWKDQSNPMFGNIAISEAQGGKTAFGRTTQDGIYLLDSLNNDLGHKTGGVSWNPANNAGPFKSTIGPDNHLYAVDFANDLVYEFNDDLSSAHAIMAPSNRTANQWVESLYVEGTGENRNIYLVNSNYNDTARKGLIKYHIGSAAMLADGDTGQQYIGPGYFTFYPRDVARDSNGDWYMNQYRNVASEAAAISKFQDGAPPINTALWETPKAAPYNGAYGIDIYEPFGWVAYGNYYDGWVHVFDMATGTYLTGFDAGNRLREVAFDAAGNIITVDNSTEWMRVWAPGMGGNSFTSESWFQIAAVPEPSSLSALLMGLPVILLRRRRR
ncbi:MAG: PEP-CTERM sorting domain-containing protein [Armatimonadetes bacterium]|nr:PEP-CTERM sorting domain-containing protein [Armatimonadota bacterium]